jgi:signal transduction histidine kinase
VRRVVGLREELDLLRCEVEELRASRERLVLAGDAERRRIERALHVGVQQHLVALAVNLQLAGTLAVADLAGTQTLLEEMARDVEQALEEAGQLAQLMYPAVLQAGGLAAALRSAAARAGISLRVVVAAGASYPPEVLVSVFWCCFSVLEQTGAGARATVAVGEEEGALAFSVEVIGAGADSAAAAVRLDANLDRFRDRVEALGGRLTLEPEPGGGVRLSGSLPVSR